MKYSMRSQPLAKRRHSWPRRFTFVIVTLAMFIGGATFVVRHYYNENLKAVSNSGTQQTVTVKNGASVDDIAVMLKKDGLIRSSWAFKLYVTSNEARSALQAGTYSLAPSQTVGQIVAQLTHGKIAINTVTILPGQRIDQVRASLIANGFKATDVDAALNPANYTDNPTLVDKPASANLEGYLFPDSFQKSDATTAQTIVEESLSEMSQQLTPELRAAFASEGLSTYQGIILASIVEQEVSTQSDRQQVAQVFLSRLHQDMMLGSDVTAYYGAKLAGQKASTTYDSPYNTLLHKGLPPTPISNVSATSLQAVAHPASTSWLYFVTGDDGVTHFSTNLQDHEALTQQYCHKLCGE